MNRLCVQVSRPRADEGVTKRAGGMSQGPFLFVLRHLVTLASALGRLILLAWGVSACDRNFKK